MTKFKVGDLVRMYGHDGIYVISEVDCLSEPMPKYKLDRPWKTQEWIYETSLSRYISLGTVWKYGNIIIYDSFYCTENENTKEVEIRIISYIGRYYYHKSVDGEVVEFKEIRE